MGTTRRLAMAQWDVFSSKPLEGNSLAVFFDGRGLSDAEMQAIAKEMNLSETTFIFPRDRGDRARARRAGENLHRAGRIAVCGTSHAGYGVRTARGDLARSEITLELNVGKVPVRFEDRAGQPTFGEMTQIDPVFGMQHEREAVARATGLSVEDFDPSLPIETVSTGSPSR